MTRARRSVFLIVLYAAVILTAGYLGYRLWSVHQAMAVIHDTSLGQFQGPAEADKVIVEFLDYRCSYCRAMHDTMQQVLAEHPDVKIIYRHYPIFGKPSIIDAEFALAAGMQGKFAEAHNILIRREDALSDRDIDLIAAELGLDTPKLRRDMKGPETGDLLLETLDITKTLDIWSTPTFIVGDIIFKPQDGPPTPENFTKLLAQAYGE